MRTGWAIGFFGAVVLASGGLLAQETFNENSEKIAGREGIAGDKGPSEPSPTISRRSPTASMAPRPSAGDPANRWRYKFHNGHWWYYRRGNQWSYWTGSAWAPYDRETYGQWFNQFRLSGSNAGSFQTYDLGRRPAGNVQREKNEPRGEGGSVDRRPSGSIQREKNDARGGDFGNAGRRPAGTVQREKNSPRGEEE